ncbi:uridine phosphorylase [Halanaerobium saccharolyticum]|uniref:Uridine phosphorylase n=1 Tax=Halanaerobium saccharolyticum TaxID=43595 RepID=A0A4R6M1P9_9FIRM|nr:uridine phosphorylase [Halanaerobium saccharolyticum]
MRILKKEIFLPILKTDSKNIRKKALVCGDPARADKIAGFLSNPEEISYNREYKLLNGLYNNKPISVLSHGVGGPGAGVAFTELIKGGVEEIIRVGTAGSLSQKIKDGDLVIASAAVRNDGLTEQLVDLSYPAVADWEIVNRLNQTANELEIKTRTGIVSTIAAFYPEIESLSNNYFSQAGAIAVEMEASALFVIASLNNIKAGAVLAIDGIAVNFDADSYDPHREEVSQAVEQEIVLALEALTREN